MIYPNNKGHSHSLFRLIHHPCYGGDNEGARLWDRPINVNTIYILMFPIWSNWHKKLCIAMLCTNVNALHYLHRLWDILQCWYWGGNNVEICPIVKSFYLYQYIKLGIKYFDMYIARSIQECWKLTFDSWLLLLNFSPQDTNACKFIGCYCLNVCHFKVSDSMQFFFYSVSVFLSCLINYLCPYVSLGEKK